MSIVDYEEMARKVEDSLLSDLLISDENKNHLRRFLLVYDVTPARRTIFLKSIRPLLVKTQDIEKELMNRDLINAIFSDLRKRYRPATYETYINISKRFVRWLYDDEDNRLPSGFKDIGKVSKSMIKRSLNHADMIEWQEGIEMTRTTHSIQRQAIITAQLDGGFRPSEFVDLNYGDVVPMDELVGFNIKGGKTGSRVVVLFRSAAFVLRWHEAHPTKNPDDPLWITEFPAHSHRKHSSGETVIRYSYPALCKVIKGAGKKAGIRKPLDFYNLRHSSCTLDKKDNLPTELGASRHGHSIKYYDEVYGRLAVENTADRFRLHYGLKNKVTAAPPLHRMCYSCGFANRDHSTRCFKCGRLMVDGKTMATMERSGAPNNEIGMLQAKLEEIGQMQAESEARYRKSEAELHVMRRSYQKISEVLALNPSVRELENTIRRREAC